MGLFFGWKLFLVSLVLTYFIGLIVTLILMLAKKVKGTSRIPFAPFLVIGTFVTLFFGNDLLNMYINTLF
jgi:leader peptidase (prepilin peptidase)/N-methyltransferase